MPVKCFALGCPDESLSLGTEPQSSIVQPKTNQIV